MPYISELIAKELLKNNQMTLNAYKAPCPFDPDYCREIPVRLTHDRVARTRLKD